jgi:hypothetical protein
MSRILHPGAPTPERWIVVAFKAGHWKQISATLRPGVPAALRMPCGSRQEAVERTHILRATNPEFAREWAGWKFCQVPLDSVVEF